MSKIDNFKALGRYICKENNVNNVLVSLGKPDKRDEIFLKYDSLKNDFSIVWADGVKMSNKLFRKLLPSALGVMLSSYRSKENQKRKEKELAKPKEINK